MRTDNMVKSEQVDLTRNAYLRRITKDGVKHVAQRVHERLPQVSPNHVTAAGAVLHAAGTFLAEYEHGRDEPRKGVLLVAAGLKLVGYGLDGVDGPLSKFKENHNSDYGGLFDYATDREEETLAAFSRARVSETATGKIAARGVAATCVWPGIARAVTEEQGRVVPEQGRNALEMLGTRPGRVVLDMVATFGSQSVQTTADTVGVVANVYSTGKRLRDASVESESVLDNKKRSQARTRKKMLTAMAVGNAALVFNSSRR